MSFEFDENEFTSEEDLQGSFVLPGQYHVRITRWDDSFSKSDSIICEFAVLAGTTPGQQGKEHSEFLPTSSPKGDEATRHCRRRIARCAWAAGAYKPGETKAISAADMEGRDLVVGIYEDEYKGKKKSKIGFEDFWPLDHVDVAAVPKGETAAEAPFDPNLDV